MKMFVLGVFFALAFAAGPARADQTLDARLLALAESWDHAQFEIADKDGKIAALQHVEKQAAAMEQQFPNRAEPIVWQAIALSSEAGADGGLGALGKVREARDLFERAEKIDANALGDGSIYTSLGSLYYQVPGFPLGFGDKDRARQYLQRALTLNPFGIEPNFFMGDFLFRQGDYAQAALYLNRALQAPARPGREIADEGRRRDARTLLAQANHKLHS